MRVITPGELLAHPKLAPYLNTLFGRGWKADHEPFMLTGTKVRQMAQKLGQFQTFIAVIPQKCMAKLAYFRRT